MKDQSNKILHAFHNSIVCQRSQALLDYSVKCVKDMGARSFFFSLNGCYESRREYLSCLIEKHPLGDALETRRKRSGQCQVW